MPTVILRGKTADIADTVTPSCPTLALLTEIIAQRPESQRGLCLVVEAELYQKAEQEMAAIRKSRGYSDLPVANYPQRNFMLFGTPIIAESEIDG